MPGGKKDEGLVMMPYSLDCVRYSISMTAITDNAQNDFKFWQGQMGSDDAFAQHCINAFE